MTICLKKIQIRYTKKQSICIKFLQILVLSCSGHLYSEALSSFRCFELEEAKIIAEDGTFLGTLDNSYSSDSIFNQYSDFGKEYHSDSIWNEYSDWGNDYSSNESSPPYPYKIEPIIITAYVV